MPNEETGLGQLSDGLWERDIEHSRPLNVHRWSDHPEVRLLTDQVWERYFKEAMEPRAKSPGKRPLAHSKKQLRVLLLDLYVAWVTDPELSIGVSMSMRGYVAGSRYNELHISSVMIDLIRRAVEVGLIGFWRGSEGAGRVSRIWPSPLLVELFRNARFGILDVGWEGDRECIILNNSSRKAIEYADTAKTITMRNRLMAYNRLLSRTFVDIPSLDTPIVELPAIGGGNPTRIRISQSDKFVRRIFYRGSWELGGRFHGGWWQHLKDWRKQIYINDQPTIEDDFSGLHIALLYGMEGVELTGDPYALEVNLPYPADTVRSWVKSLALVTINARNEKKAFGAFRSEQLTGSPAKNFSDAQLLAILDAFRAKHPAIAHHLCSDIGVHLMAIDGRIAARVIDHFTAIDVPVLSIHDSFIVPFNWAQRLRQVMKLAVRHELAITSIGVKRVGRQVEYSDEWLWSFAYSDSFSITRKTAGYLHRKGQFEDWSGIQFTPDTIGKDLVTVVPANMSHFPLRWNE